MKTPPEKDMAGGVLGSWGTSNQRPHSGRIASEAAAQPGCRLPYTPIALLIETHHHHGMLKDCITMHSKRKREYKMSADRFLKDQQTICKRKFYYSLLKVFTDVTSFLFLDKVNMIQAG